MSSPSTLAFVPRGDVDAEIIVQKKVQFVLLYFSSLSAHCPEQAQESEWEGMVEREINTPFAVGGRGSLAWRLVIVQPTSAASGLGTDLICTLASASPS